MNIIELIWISIQILIGYNLIIPAVLYCLWLLFKRKSNKGIVGANLVPDYAFIVTAYQFTETLPSVVSSILNSKYGNYLVYIIADNCDVNNLHFDDERVILLQPPQVLGGNTRSHSYAFSNFRRSHDIVTIIDSDNIVAEDYLDQLTVSFSSGFDAVQGLRAAKNLDGTIARLDAARDIYYHFYDGKLLFECGSSATLSGSGMAFKAGLYKEFLDTHDVVGAGFDKVLQFWLVKSDIRIAFNEAAIVYDEKTSRPDQLVKQRSRWINTWFKYFKLGFHVLFAGITKFNRNQVLFGMVLLRPPLFLFLIASALCFLINLFMGNLMICMIWLVSGLLFILFFLVALFYTDTDKRIYSSLVNIPKFIAYQIISLLKSRNANKNSVSTQHYFKEDKE